MIPGIETFFSSYSEKPGDYWTSTVGVIMALFGVLAIIFQIQDLLRYSKAVKAVLFSSEPTYKTKRGNEHSFNNVYEYVIDKEKYKLKVKENAKHEKGYETDIYVNSKKPSDARLVRSSRMIPFGIVLIVVGVIIFLRGLTIAKG